MNMLDFLDTVSNHLENLCHANQNLLRALKEYQKLLISGENESVGRATPHIDRLTSQIRRLDEDRRLFVDDYFVRNGWEGARNFSAIADHVRSAGVADDEAAAFERCQNARARLIAVLAEVDAQNSLNLTLIGQGLNFAEVSLRTLLGVEENHSTYGPGEMADEGPSFLDAQV